MMKLSFENKYEYTHTFPTYRQNCIDLNPRSLEPSNSKFRESWLKLRRYDYYQEHKKYVDMVEEMEDVSSMTEEASILKEYVRKESDKRLAEVKAFKDYMFEIDKTLVCGIESPLGELYIDKKEEPSLKLK